MTAFRRPDRVAEAVAEQQRLAGHVVRQPPPGFAPRIAAGLDVAYADEAGDGPVRLAAAAVCVDIATGAVVDTAVVPGWADFPYVPGLFAYRELPSLVAALERLTVTPDVLVADGHGIAHPRRFGLASHLGVVTGRPSIGVAKNPSGPYAAPGLERGATAPLIEDGGDVVGAALRSRTGVKPVFVSVGHLVDLPTACAIVLELCRGTRLPETTRQADRRCRAGLAD